MIILMKDIDLKQKIKVGLVQINNSFSNQNYFPYSVGLLQAHVQKHAQAPDEYEFLLPLYKRIPVEAAAQHLLKADVVGFSVYVWNIRISLAIAKTLKRLKPNILTVFELHRSGSCGTVSAGESIH